MCSRAAIRAVEHERCSCSLLSCLRSDLEELPEATKEIRQPALLPLPVAAFGRARRLVLGPDRLLKNRSLVLAIIRASFVHVLSVRLAANASISRSSRRRTSIAARRAVLRTPVGSSSIPPRYAARASG